MIELIISGIDSNIGPGDIVGAFINEARIDSDDIGKINIFKEKANVEVREEVAKQVIQRMNNNEIGGIKVNVNAKNEEVLSNKKLYKYINKYKDLVELERREEMERHELEIKRLSPEEREKKGRAILHLKGRDAGKAFGNKQMVKFMRQRPGEELPDTEITVGDLVMISKNKVLDDKNPTGTVAEKTRYSVTVVFDREPVPFVYGKGLRLDLYVNDITFQRMLTALADLKKAKGRLLELRGKLLGLKELNWKSESIAEPDWKKKNLNPSQKEAVKKALKAEDFYLIQGPPGTGKTMTAIEIIHQAVIRKQSILATADSNIAVDNLVERLANSGVKVVRVGHPLRVTPVLREHTLDYKVLEHSDYIEAQKLRKEVNELLAKQDELTHPSGRWRRGLSNKQIKDKARNNQGSRGVPPHKIMEMAKWLKLQDEIDEYFTEIDRLENDALDDLINNAEVVCSTNSTAGSELMQDRKFDIIVIDEATQATEPATLISLIKGEKTILIGDHRQLPPTVLNEKAEEEGLSKSLFERMYEMHGTEFWSLLEVQYRMHDKIMDFSNRKFYDNRLISDKKVKEHTLADLGINPEKYKCFTDKALKPDMPIVFLDTSSMEAKERSLAGSNSYDNPVEAEIVLDVLDESVKLGLAPEKIAVITPYKDQVDLLNHRNKIEKVEINTVDGFQGREKEMIICSLVRSNHNKNIGFLRDLRRLNVTLTRAKRKLILIGDSNTVQKHSIYNDLINYIKKEGLFYTL